MSCGMDNKTLCLRENIVLALEQVAFFQITGDKDYLDGAIKRMKYAISEFEKTEARDL